MAKIGHKILVASQTQLALFASSFFFSFSEAHSSKVIMVHQNSKGLLTQGPLRSLANVSSEILTKQIPY